MIVVGVDAHKNTHTLVAVDALGRRAGEFPNAMMATHTENRSMRMHGASLTVPIPGDPYANSHPVQPLDHIVIDGEAVAI